MQYIVSGTVRLDPWAESLLALLPTGEWLAAADADGDGTDGALQLVHHDGCVELVAADATGWLGFSVLEDLATANLIGDVRGTISVSVAEGVDEVAVASFDGRGRTFYGEARCLVVDEVRARRVMVCESGDRPYSDRTFRTVLDADGRDTVRTVAFTAHADLCSCADNPGVCRGVPAPVADLPPGTTEALDAASATLALGALDELCALVGGGLLDEVCAFYDATLDMDPTGALAWVERHPWGALAGATTTQLAWSLHQPGGPFDGRDDVSTAVEVLARAADAGLATRRDTHQWRVALGQLATHEAMTWDLACEVGLDRTAARMLAANEGICDSDALTLPATVVAEVAPWRFGTGFDAHVALKMAPRWHGDARSLVEVARATTAGV